MNPCLLTVCCKLKHLLVGNKRFRCAEVLFQIINVGEQLDYEKCILVSFIVGLITSSLASYVVRLCP